MFDTCEATKSVNFKYAILSAFSTNSYGFDCYLEMPTKSIKTGMTDEGGFYQLGLDPGEYMVFLREPYGWLARQDFKGPGGSEFGVAKGTVVERSIQDKKDRTD